MSDRPSARASNSARAERLKLRLERLDPTTLDTDGRIVPWLPEEIERSERAPVDGWRAANQRSTDRQDLPLTGLALSGGGVRSATFCLGVLQRLVESSTLGRFDYLSTVSGGGYIGSSLSYLARHPGFGCDPGGFPYGLGTQSSEGHRDSPTQRALLRHLRQHGRYLNPDRRMTLAAGAAAVLRAIFSNLVVWVPILTAIMIVMQRPLGSVDARTCNKDLSTMLALSVGSAQLDCATVFTVALWGTALVTAGAIAVAIVYSLSTRFERWPGAFAWFGGLATMRRAYEVIGGRLLILGVGLGVVASIPLVHALLAGWAAQAAPSAILAGAASGLWSLLSGGASTSKLPKFLIPIAAILVLYGTLLGAYVLALPVYGLSATWWWWFWLLAALALGGGLGWFVNVNLVGLHRFYRDRLMEAFMPNLVGGGQPVSGAATDADRTYLPADAARPQAMPFHLINTNVVLVNSDVSTRHERMGDSFCLSPLWCGGTAVGWQPTSSFLEGKLSLPTAMAVSGAAANPNATALSDPFVGLLATLLNIRLGIWVATPSPQIFARSAPPTHFHAAWHELAKLFGRGYHEHSALLQLTDGGHFENLGIYELVRRQVEVIVVVDAVADPDYEFVDLFRALRLIEEDFGVRPAPAPNVADLLRPLMRDATLPAGYPPERWLSGECWFHCALVGKGPDGKKEYKADLYYITTTLTGSMPWRSRGYWTGSKDFPDETTADQFFDPDQFDAYRLLGYQSADEALRGAVGAETLEQRLQRM